MKKIIFLTSLISFVLVGGIIYQNFYKKNSQIYKNPYYSKLAKECEKEKSSKSCCLASVRAMEADKAFLAKDNKCPVGYKREMFKCIGTYQWCQKRKAY